jgi:NAD(P) transhydrogenase subunit alpha
VWCYDFREDVREQVQSLGASFVELEIEIADMEDKAGYARALGEEKARRQTELLVPQISKSDIIVTTALIPGRPAPLLITEEAVAAMQPGSVIIDIAAPNGGNCALTEPGQTVVHNGVQIFGPLNLPSSMPVHASQMYSRTVLAMLDDFAETEGFKVNFEDEVFKGSCVTHDGQVVHERVKGLLVN